MSTSTSLVRAREAQLGDDAGLADAGVATDEHGGRAAAGDVVEGACEDGHLLGPPDEPRTRHAVPHAPRFPCRMLHGAQHTTLFPARRTAGRAGRQDAELEPRASGRARVDRVLGLELGEPPKRSGGGGESWEVRPSGSAASRTTKDQSSSDSSPTTLNSRRAARRPGAVVEGDLDLVVALLVADLGARHPAPAGVGQGSVAWPAREQSRRSARSLSSSPPDSASAHLTPPPTTATVTAPPTMSWSCGHVTSGGGGLCSSRYRAPRPEPHLTVER